MFCHIFYKSTAPIVVPNVADEVYKKCQDLEETSDNAMVPYYNKSSKEYDCVPILKRGPCDLNHWVVINKETRGMVHLKI